MGTVGFEPTTSHSEGERSDPLNYVPHMYTPYNISPGAGIEPALLPPQGSVIPLHQPGHTTAFKRPTVRGEEFESPV